MKTLTLLAIAAIAAITTGCGGGGRAFGPAKTTLDPMKNVGPVLVEDFHMEVKNGKTNSFSITRHMESPEAAQTRLREAELKSRRAHSSGGAIYRQPQYWWQGQTGVNLSGPHEPVYGSGVWGRGNW